MLSTILGFFGGLKNKLLLAGSFVVGVLYMLLRIEKSKRKAAEKEASIEKSNRKLLEKEKEVVTDLDLHREKDIKRLADKKEKQATQIEELKHETDNDNVVDNIVRLLDKDSNED